MANSEIENVQQNMTDGNVRQWKQTVLRIKQQAESLLDEAAVWQCENCQKLRKKVNDLENRERDLKDHIKRQQEQIDAGCEQLYSTYISERQQVKIDNMLLEAKQSAERKAQELAIRDREIMELRKNLTEMKNDLHAMRSQCDVFEDDFKKEKEDRKHAEKKLADARRQLQQYAQNSQETVEQQVRRPYRRIPAYGVDETDFKSDNFNAETNYNFASSDKTSMQSQRDVASGSPAKHVALKASDKDAVRPAASSSHCQAALELVDRGLSLNSGSYSSSSSDSQVYKTDLQHANQHSLTEYKTDSHSQNSRQS